VTRSIRTSSRVGRAPARHRRLGGHLPEERIIRQRATNRPYVPAVLGILAPFLAMVLGACAPDVAPKATEPIVAHFPGLEIVVPVAAGVCRSSGANRSSIWLWVDELTPLPHGVGCEGGAGRYTIVAFRSWDDEAVVNIPLSVRKPVVSSAIVSTVQARPASGGPQIRYGGESWLLMPYAKQPTLSILLNGKPTGVFYTCQDTDCALTFRYRSTIAGMTWFTSRPPIPTTPAEVLRAALLVNHALERWSHSDG